MRLRSTVYDSFAREGKGFTKNTMKDTIGTKLEFFVFVVVRCDLRDPKFTKQTVVHPWTPGVFRQKADSLLAGIYFDVNASTP